MKLIKKNNKKGFTLIELVIVIAILAILALILVPAIGKYIGNANDAKNEASARTIYTNAVLAHSTIDYEGEDAAARKTELETEVENISNVKSPDTVTITMNSTNTEVESIAYTVGSEVFTFDGKDFEKTTVTP